MKDLSILLLASTLALAAPVQAADQDRVQTRDPSTHTTPSPDQEGQQVYGWGLMSEKERSEYMNRMRSLKTDQEREALRAEHHKDMQKRAKAQGKVLPDVPQGVGWGVGKGAGPAEPAVSQAQDRVYGWELMSEKERSEYMNRMRSLKTDQEREALRQEHHKKMQERAKIHGKDMPDMPQGSGNGQGKGQGAGAGKH